MWLIYYITILQLLQPISYPPFTFAKTNNDNKTNNNNKGILFKTHKQDQTVLIEMYELNTCKE